MPKLLIHSRWLLPAVAVFLILLIGSALSGRAPANQNSSVITAVVERRDLEQSVLADGTLEAKKQVSVGAQVSGQIKAIHVALGQQVKQGDLLVEIDDLTQQNSLKDAEAQQRNIQAQLESKQATLRNAQLTFERQQRILDKGLGSRSDFDSAKATLDETRATIRALDAQLVQAKVAADTARVNLGYTRITAPLSGTVVAIPVEEGQTVNAAQSTPTLLKIAQLETMTIKAQISEADVVKTRAGMPVYFTILGAPQSRFDAQLRAIEPAPDSINDDDSSSSSSSSSSSNSSSSSSTAIYYNGLFDVPNPDGTLRISMTAQVYIVLAKAEKTLVIPATALMGDQVQVMDHKGQLSQRRVKVGLNNKVDAQILDGLQEGERVVISTASAASSKSSDGGMRPPPMGL